MERAGVQNDESLIEAEVISSNDFIPVSKRLIEEPAEKVVKSDILENEDLAKSCDVPRSKKELKRELKQQKRMKMRAEWKLQRKLKSKNRHKSRNQNISISNAGKPKITPMAESTNKFRVVIDFSYDELMSLKDLTKCGNQVVRCYSANRRSSNPLQLYFCNFSGKIREEMSKSYEYGRWDIHFHEDSYLNVFSKEELVYLTSESKNVLETLEENKVYIIGGLVDHNAHKGVSYRKAFLEGIAHAQLPIRKYIQMKTRSVLTINHVFEILLKVSNGEAWSAALYSAVPQRFFENSIPSRTSKDALGENSSDEKTNETRFDEGTNFREECITDTDIPVEVCEDTRTDFDQT